MQEDFNFQATIDFQDGVSVFRCKNSMTTSRKGVLIKKIQDLQLHPSRPQNVLLDLSQVDYIDSDSIDALLRINSDSKKKGAQFALLSPTEVVQNLLRIRRVDQIFTAFGDEATALQMLRSAPAAQIHEEPKPV